MAGDEVSASPYLIRSGTVEDATVAARLHAEQISTGFLSYLGPRFLERLYRRVVLWDGGFLLVAVEAERGSAAAPPDPARWSGTSPAPTPPAASTASSCSTTAWARPWAPSDR